MISKGQLNAEEIKIQGLLDRFLRVRSANSNFNNNHLDEDSLAAFVEGKINEKESPNIIQHLVDCSFCLHVTGELAKLHMAFEADEVVVANPSKEPMKFSEVLSGIMSKIFGTNDAAVFAHEEKEEETEKESDEDKKVF
ncbi:MAG: hypothetical protein K1X72_19420 [Pyrinomonadaceae bacterium]|nr:hypothetical protein [Pyrinomonadaceae bacterium]